MELKRVVVTGLGAITPVGNGVPEFWENIVNGVSGAGPITHFDASLVKTQFACEVKNFDVTKYIAVSYTHLDVYKRQPLCLPVRSAPTKFTFSGKL